MHTCTCPYALLSLFTVTSGLRVSHFPDADIHNEEMNAMAGILQHYFSHILFVSSSVCIYAAIQSRLQLIPSC